MTVRYRRKNRKTKGIIYLHQKRKYSALPANWHYRFWCQCDHGATSGKTRHISYAIDWMARPDFWCRKCEDVVKKLQAAPDL